MLTNGLFRFALVLRDRFFRDGRRYSCSIVRTKKEICLSRFCFSRLILRLLLVRS